MYICIFGAARKSFCRTSLITAITSRQGTYLGVGSRLYRYNALTQKFDKWWDLISQVTSIEGLAYDRTANTMVVLDGANQKLVELRFDGKQ